MRTRAGVIRPTRKMVNSMGANQQHWPQPQPMPDRNGPGRSSFCGCRGSKARRAGELLIGLVP